MSDITRTQIALRLPEDQITQVDTRADALGISRNQWYENMTRWVLANTATMDERQAALTAKVAVDAKHRWKRDPATKRDQCERCGILDGMFAHVVCQG